MKKNLLFVLLCLIFNVSNGQFTSPKNTLIDDISIKNKQKLNKNSNKPKKCNDGDTIEYARYKASGFNAINCKRDYSLGQFFGAPQDIKIHGFTFHAWLVSSTPTGKKVNLICRLYRAGLDSLPTGSPLAADTIAVDTTFGGGMLSVMQKSAVFNNPVTVNFPYILTVESDSSTINCGVVANSWTASPPNGRRENYLCGSVAGRWYRGLNLNISGSTLDADMIFSPYVTYSYGNDFTFVDCNTFKDTIRFKNNSNKTVAGSKFYNYYAFYKIEQYSHLWNFGDNPWSGQYFVDAKYKYSSKGNYDVRLITNVYRFQGGQCTDTVIKTIYFKPNALSFTGNQICTGDSAIVTAISDAGVVHNWYNIFSDTIPFYTGDMYNFGKPTSSKSYFVQAQNFHCSNPKTQLDVNVNDYPNMPVPNHDSICQGAKANLGATSNYGVIEWYSDTLMKKIFVGNSMQTDILQKDTFFWVRANNNGCTSNGFVKVRAWVGSDFAPSEPLVSKDTNICLRPTGIATIYATSPSNDSLYWYDKPKNGTLIAKGNIYQYTASSIITKIVYVESANTVCGSSRVPVTITVNDYPNITTTFADTKCKGDSGLVGVIIESTGNATWWDQPSGGNFIDSSTIIIVKPNATKDYYVSVFNQNCINPSRSKATFVIKSFDEIESINIPPVCSGNKVSISAQAGTSNISWYSDIELKNKLFTGNNYTTSPLSSNQIYYIQSEKNGCKGKVVEVPISILPLPISGYSYQVLTDRRIKFTPAADNGVTYKWFTYDNNVTYVTKFPTHKFSKNGVFKVKLEVTNILNQCKDSSIQTIIIDNTGIVQLDENRISVYPIPAHSQLNIDYKNINTNQIQIKLNNVLGQNVYQFISTSNSEVPQYITAPQDKGIYILQIITNEGTWIKKIQFD